MLSKILCSRFKALTPSLQYSQSVIPVTFISPTIQKPLVMPQTATKNMKPPQSFIPLKRNSFRLKPIKSLFKTAKQYFSEAQDKKEQAPSDQEILKQAQVALETAKKTNNYTNYLAFAETVITIKKKLHGEDYTEGRFEDMRNIGFGNMIETKYTEGLFFLDEALKYAKKEMDFLEAHLYLGQLYMVMNNDESAMESLDQGYIHAKTLFSSYLSQPGETLLKIAYNTINVSRNLMEVSRKRMNNAKVKTVLSENIQMFQILLRISPAFANKCMRDFLAYTYECCEELTELALREGDHAAAEKAISHQLEAVAVANDHFYRARALFNQGLVDSHKGKYDTAAAAFIKAKEFLFEFMEEKPKDSYFQELQPQYLQMMYLIYGGLTNVYFRNDLREEGLKVIAENEEFFKKYPLEDPFAYQHIQIKKAEFLVQDKKFAEAFPILEQINVAIEKLDLNEIRNLSIKSFVLTLISNVGGEVEKYEEALKAALENEKLIPVLLKEFPEKKETVVDNKYIIGALYGRLKKFPEAQQYLQIALAMYKSQEGRDNEIDRIYLDLAKICEENGDKVKARAFYTNSLEIRKKMSKAVADSGMEPIKEKIEELKPTKKKKNEPTKAQPKKKDEKKGAKKKEEPKKK